MATATKHVHPRYVSLTGRADHATHRNLPINSERLTDAVLDEWPRLVNLTWPDFCRWAIRRNEEIWGMSDELRFDVNQADELVCRNATGSAQIVETFSTVIGDKLIEAAEAEPDTTADWVQETAAINFLPQTLFTLEHGARLEKQTRGRKAESTSFGTKGEAWGINRYTGQFVLDEQNMLDGQHVGATLLAVSQHGAAAARVRPDLIYALLLNNPTLASDNIALFHASHTNLVSGGGSALAGPSLDSGISAIGLQTLVDLQTHEEPIHTNLQAKYLLVPPQLVGPARRAVRNMVLGDGNDLIVRQESRLSTLGLVDPKSDLFIANSAGATNWLLTAQASSRPTIVVGGLVDNNLKPQLRRFDLEHGHWGMGWDIVLDIGAAAIDYRGVYYSVGA